MMFADEFVGISKTAEGLEKQGRQLSIEYTRKWRVTVDVKRAQ